MLDEIFKVLFLIGLVAASAIRLFYERQYRQNEISELRSRGVSRLERLLLVLLFFAMIVLPLIYVSTPWLIFADYRLPMWIGWLGTVIFLAALLLLWRSHADLGPNWLATVDVREGHRLVTDGVYRHIRHPMYAAHLLWAIAQALLLQNWIAGLAYLLFLIPLYALRVPREEQMMLRRFGQEYRTYIDRTNRLIPNPWRHSRHQETG